MIRESNRSFSLPLQRSEVRMILNSRSSTPWSVQFKSISLFNGLNIKKQYFATIGQTCFVKHYKFFFYQNQYGLYNAYERDIAVVNIFFGDTTAIGITHVNIMINIKMYFLEYQKDLRMTTSDFISNIGGLFGLFLGCSFISFFEIFYWVVIKTIKS